MARKYNTDDDYLRLPIRTKTAKRFFKAYVVMWIIGGSIPILAWAIFLGTIFSKDKTHSVEMKFEKFTPIDEMESWKNWENERKKRVEEYQLRTSTPSESSER